MGDIIIRPGGDLALPDLPQDFQPDVDQMITIWLDAKTQKSGSGKTSRAYADTMQSFRSMIWQAGADLDTPRPSLISTAAQGWANQGDPAPATFNQRLAIISSFYQFAMKRGWIEANPISLVERRGVQEYSSARPLSYDAVRARLAAIDRSAPAGARDYAMLAIALQTGRRVAEIAAWRWGDVIVEAGAVTIVTRRAKGGKIMQDQLPTAVGRALLTWLHMFHGAKLGDLSPDAPLWINLSRNGYGTGLSTMSISRICEEHLGTSKVHALRHTFARAMEDAGAKVSDIQARLGHASLQTTSRYLAAMKSAENPHADALAALLGIDKL